MVEVRASFGSFAEWESWQGQSGDFSAARQAIGEDVKTHGLIEPMTGIRRYPHEITVRDDNLHESLSAGGLNSRKRALLAQLHAELKRRRLTGNLGLRILGTDALSQIALILRGIYPYFSGLEYAATAAARERLFPVATSDFQHLDYPDTVFDAVVSADALEQVPDFGQAMREILRVLKPGGLLIASIPFSQTRRGTEAPGATPDEAAGEQRSSVLQLQGWDLLDRLRGWGCEDAYCTTIASSQYGIASEGKPGPFILTAQKAGGSVPAPPRPAAVTFRDALPEKLCVLVALPRSGTTLMTSLFAVHSKVEAVYEPWNAKRLAMDGDSTVETLIAAEKLRYIQGKTLFVKETSAQSIHVQRLRTLYDTAPPSIGKDMLLLLRQPEYTYLSEITRRAEWWNDSVELGLPSFEAWCAKSKHSMRLMLDFAIAADGVVVGLEQLAAQPEKLLSELCARLGLSVEREQLNYEQHLDKKRVRGDINIGKNPDRIDKSKPGARSGSLALIDGWLAESQHAAWFAAFRALHQATAAHGGIIPARSIAREVLAPMLGKA